ncbi:MAG TPA: PadR family transcriptional regulator [Nitrososphaerales archaeon]|nr:PadR family transcriptional regulator [Nitrososphaerales archaeon]
MSSAQELWMGYRRDGERAILDVGGPGNKILLLGSRSGVLSALASISAKEAGARPILFDLDGSLANRLSGHFDTFDYRSFLYDAFRLEEPEPWHSQLAAAAYAAALDLSSEEEAIINSAMQVVATEGAMLSPVSLYDVLGKVEGFRGFYVDKLRGRIGSLRHFDAVDDQKFAKVKGDIIMDFHRAPYPQVAELAAALFLSKLLTAAHASGNNGSFVLVTEAHRVFRGSPKPALANRLLSLLLEWSASVVFSSDQPDSLSPLLLRSCPVRIYSSDTWHSQRKPVENILSSTFVVHDKRNNSRENFVPRRVVVKTADYAPAGASKLPTPDLTKMVLEEVDRYTLSTPESIVQYIAPEFLSSDVVAALAGLENQGFLILEPKESGSGPEVFCYTLTDKGRRLLKELRK